MITLKLEYRTVWGENLILCGDDGKIRRPMEYGCGGIWSIKIPYRERSVLDIYHYEVEKEGVPVRREWRFHSLDTESLSARGHLEVRDSWQDIPDSAPFHSAAFTKGIFKKAGSSASTPDEYMGMKWKGAGTAVPVFSLRSRHSFGVGEFNDLKLLADWAAATGQRVIQILPVNDTTMTGTWEDSYPYRANSIYALHPQFIHLPAAGVPEDDEYIIQRDVLDSLPEIDYEQVNDFKDLFLRKAFGKTWKKVSSSAEYRSFFEENASWLVPYAAFRILTGLYDTADYHKWGSYSKYGRKKIQDFCASNRREAEYHYFVQYHLHLQLKEACDYARGKGVVLKGDLPIGISRTSADAWAWPGLFYLDESAGAPPDAFSVSGQNWGLPTYDWDRMSMDGYAWWKKRLRNMSRYFDAFRIDHILGFFRIWEIPLQVSGGLLGHFSPAMPYSACELASAGFDVSVPGISAPLPDENVLFIEDPRRPGYYHPRIAAQSTSVYGSLDGWHKDAFNRLYDDFFYCRHNAFWKESAMRKLPELLGATDMLACGEDLGMIPACVPETMGELKILSLEIQRMPKAFNEAFADVAEYPYYSVCSTSTHDMNPLRAWWEEDRDTACRFFNDVLHEQGEAPAVCEPWICRRIVDMHLSSPSMLAILPIQDWLSMEDRYRIQEPGKERINVPSDPGHYWRYRMPVILEDLIADKDFRDKVYRMVAASGR